MTATFVKSSQPTLPGFDSIISSPEFPGGSKPCDSPGGQQADLFGPARAPAPPFSAAGKKKHCPECQSREVIPHPYQTGIFACVGCAHEWHADARHLWPEFYRLIRECRPEHILGEQVAGPDGLVWLAGVRGTLAPLGYGFRAADLCGPCVGSPDIRQRLYWGGYRLGHAEHGRPGGQEPRTQPWSQGCVRGGVADSESEGRWANAGAVRSGATEGLRESEGQDVRRSCECAGRTCDCGSTVRMADANNGGCDTGGESGRLAEVHRRTTDERMPVAEPGSLFDGMEYHASNGRIEGRAESERGSGASGRGDVERVGDTNGERRNGQHSLLWSDQTGRNEATFSETAGSSESGIVGDSDIPRQQGRSLSDDRCSNQCSAGATDSEKGFAPPRPRPDAGFWDTFAIILCGDNKHRRIPAPQPGVLGMDHGLFDGLEHRWLSGFPLADEKIEGRVGLLRGFGNAIKPQLAAEFIRAYMECEESA